MPYRPTPAAEDSHLAPEKSKQQLQEWVGKTDRCVGAAELELRPAAPIERVRLRGTGVKSCSELSGRKRQPQQSIQFNAFKTVWVATLGPFPL